MVDTEAAPLRDAVQQTFEGLLELVGLSIIDAPLAPPQWTLHVPVTSVDIAKADETIKDIQVRMNMSVNRAFEEAIEVMKAASARPKAARVIVSVSRKSFMHHVYATFEFYNEVPRE